MPIHQSQVGQRQALPVAIPPDLIARRDNGTLERGEVALVSLLDMADVTLEDFQVTDRHERLIRELENSGNVLSEEVFEYWSQSVLPGPRLVKSGSGRPDLSRYR